MTANSLTALSLEDPVTALRGVGPERAGMLARLEVHSIGDLLLHRPRRYEDRRHLLRIAEVQEKGAVTVRGRVVARGMKYFRRRRQSVFEMVLDDGSGRLHCRWWNSAFLESHYAVDDEVMAHGRVVALRPPTMDHPETEVLENGEEASIHLDRIVPIYPLTEGLTQRWLRGCLWQLLGPLAGQSEEPFPAVDRGDLPARAEALRQLHFPDTPAAAEEARRRLAFDEFVALQWAIQSRRRRLFAHAVGWPCAGDNRLIRPFLKELGFRLTEAQTGVLREIRQDLGSGRPMRRMVQGEVGSGKTVVAACAALMAAESGFSTALMAPTEILAQQHWARFARWFEPLGVPVGLQTAACRSEAAMGEARGLTIGTHALITDGYAPDHLGLVIIDEQHRFGVAQREALVRKGRFPHLLVMTATPIPRTLALTLYGDLDNSVLRQGPPGRGTIRTFVRSRDGLPRVWAFVREQLEAGRQAYVVFPRIDGDGTGEVRAVNRERGALAKVLAPHRVEVMHGRLDADAKARVMADFARGSIAVLLATSVVEVGLDVPNATVMVIENAEQFGLAQLHQLRGRIGRGGHDAYCILVAAKESEASRSRLKVLEEQTDGFAIAEADLRLRGPGELLGLTQSGLPALHFGDLASDAVLLERARTAVADALDRESAPRRPSG